MIAFRCRLGGTCVSFGLDWIGLAWLSRLFLSLSRYVNTASKREGLYTVPKIQKPLLCRSRVSSLVSTVSSLVSIVRLCAVLAPPTLSSPLWGETLLDTP